MFRYLNTFLYTFLNKCLDSKHFRLDPKHVCLGSKHLCLDFLNICLDSKHLCLEKRLEKCLGGTRVY